MKTKIKKWFIESCINDFYKWNNVTLFAITIIWVSMFFNNWYVIGSIIFVVVLSTFNWLYFKKWRRLFIKRMLIKKRMLTKELVNEIIKEMEDWVLY